MTTTTVGQNTSTNGYDVTSGNTLEIQSGGFANTTTVESGGTLQIDGGGSGNAATVKSGGVEVVLAGGSENAGTIQAGATETVSGTINSTNVVTQAGMTNADDVFGTLNVGSGGSVNAVTVENGGSLNLTAKSASASNVTVNTGGLLTINGNASANNVTLQGGTLDLQSGKADSVNTTAGIPSATGNLTFAANTSSTLQIDVAQTGSNGTTFAQTIAGFAQGDIVDLRAATFAGATLQTSQNGNNTTVTVIGGGGSATETFTFSGTQAAAFALAPDTQATPGTEIVYTAVCFASGTAIRTARGDVAVEHLAVGDVAVTASGERKPIRWLGHRRVDCRGHAEPAAVLPVRIAAHAFGPGLPLRDLVVSPGHAICVDVLGEVLVPALALVNGTTIRQLDVDAVTYWHVELDTHEVILAESLPAESYLDMGNRGFFAEAGVVTLAVALPDQAGRSHADFCRPFHGGGPVVAAIRRRLDARAAALADRTDAAVARTA